MTILRRYTLAAIVGAGAIAVPASVACASAPIYLGEVVVQGGRVMDTTPLARHPSRWQHFESEATNVRWSRWGSSAATGTGTLAGEGTSWKLKLVAHRPRRCGRKTVYTRVTEFENGKRAFNFGFDARRCRIKVTV
jgi:hypothetical protein